MTFPKTVRKLLFLCCVAERRRSDVATIYDTDGKAFLKRLYLVQDICQHSTQEEHWYQTINLHCRALLASHFILKDAQTNGNIRTGRCRPINPELDLDDTLFSKVLSYHVANERTLEQFTADVDANYHTEEDTGDDCSDAETPALQLTGKKKLQNPQRLLPKTWRRL